MVIDWGTEVDLLTIIDEVEGSNLGYPGKKNVLKSKCLDWVNNSIPKSDDDKKLF